MKLTNDSLQTRSDDSIGSSTEHVNSLWRQVVKRRSFLRGIGLAGAAASLPVRPAFGLETGPINLGDAALLQFALLAETLETDLWQQYNELGGAVDDNNNPNTGNPEYLAALSNLDEDMPQYISDNTDDEISHRDFLRAYLISRNIAPVDLSQFATLTSSVATGAAMKGRLTNLRALTVDTSWYFRYRSTQNPDLGTHYPSLLSIANVPAIPLHDNNAQTTIQAIANVAAIHFAFIEQGGSSLYPVLALKATSLEVLRILLSIGGVEIAHFEIWHDKMGAAISEPLAPLFDPVTKLMFPDFNAAANQMNAGLSAADQAAGSQMFQTNLILPEPCQFLSADLPACSVIRPTLDANAGPMAAVTALTEDNLFVGQSQEFFDVVMGVASAAEAAQRQLG